MTVTLRFNATDSQRAIARLREKAPYAIARALNRAAGSARTQLARDVSRDMRIRVGDVRDKVNIVEATRDRPTATIYASAKRLPLIAFGARGPYPSRGKGKGVTAKLPGGRYPRAFIAIMRSGHRGVFERRSKGRLPIKELFGPSIAKVAETYVPAAADRGREQLLKNLQSEFRFATRAAA